MSTKIFQFDEKEFFFFNFAKSFVMLKIKKLPGICYKCHFANQGSVAFNHIVNFFLYALVSIVTKYYQMKKKTHSLKKKKKVDCHFCHDNVTQTTCNTKVPRIVQIFFYIEKKIITQLINPLVFLNILLISSSKTKFNSVHYL